MSDDDVEAMDGDEPGQKGIKDPNDTDVLCGRGGAALRHPGNQTYRRLVNLNKGLYITCLKTEKLKISRSIVAAIREQNGRFLEKNGDKGLWMDIGDKKAIEKTSQALREGQPKLRQKIVEMGGGATGTQAFIEQQFGANGIYHPDVGMAAAAAAASAGGMPPPVGPGFGISPHGGIPAMPPQQAAIAAQAAAMGSARNLNAGNLEMMPPPPARPAASASANPSGAEMYAQSLSMSQHGAANGGTGGGAADMDLSYHRTMQLRPSAVKRGSFANTESGRSLMSDFSAIGNSNHMANNDLLFGSRREMQDVSQGGSILSSSSHGEGKQRFDRRSVFANSKYFRKPSEHNLGLQDGMPEIHMVESNPSLFSDLSGRGASKHNRMPMEALGSGSGLSSGLSSGPGGSGSGLGSGLSGLGGTSNVPIELGGGSRHSIMSGLSRISDNSEVHSIFSDLSRKIGNVSTRSIAMSEISGIDERDREDDDDSHTFGTFASESRASEVPKGSTSNKAEAQGAGGMDFDW